MEPLSILFQDDCLVAINKPPDLLIHRSELDPHESQNAMTLLRNQLGQWVYPIHRLDKPTSGVLLFALNQEVARHLSDLFAQQLIMKSYLAIVRGFTDVKAKIDYPLKNQWHKQLKRKNRPLPSVQTAITEYHRLATIELPYAVGPYPTARYSFIKVFPKTGRNRQIRRHMKHIFHPIVGDVAYGDGKHNAFFRKQYFCHRLLLHAHAIHFKHPMGETKLSIQAPLFQDFQRVIDTFQWNNISLE